MSTTAVPHVVHSLAKKAKNKTDSLARKVVLAAQGAVLAVRAGGVEHINHAAHAREVRELRDRIQAEHTTNDMLSRSNQELRERLTELEQNSLDAYFPAGKGEAQQMEELTPTEERVLLYLASHRLLGNKQIARPSSSGAPTKKLLDKGLVTTDKDDMISLTAKGEQVVRRLLS